MRVGCVVVLMAIAVAWTVAGEGHRQLPFKTRMRVLAERIIRESERAEARMRTREDSAMDSMVSPSFGDDSRFDNTTNLTATATLNGTDWDVPPEGNWTLETTPTLPLWNETNFTISMTLGNSTNITEGNMTLVPEVDATATVSASLTQAPLPEDVYLSSEILQYMFVVSVPTFFNSSSEFNTGAFAKKVFELLRLRGQAYLLEEYAEEAMYTAHCEAQATAIPWIVFDACMTTKCGFNRSVLGSCPLDVVGCECPEGSDSFPPVDPLTFNESLALHANRTNRTAEGNSNDSADSSQSSAMQRVMWVLETVGDSNVRVEFIPRLEYVPSFMPSSLQSVISAYQSLFINMLHVMDDEDLLATFKIDGPHVLYRPLLRKNEVTPAPTPIPVRQHRGDSDSSNPLLYLLLLLLLLIPMGIGCFFLGRKVHRYVRDVQYRRQFQLESNAEIDPTIAKGLGGADGHEMDDMYPGGEVAVSDDGFDPLAEMGACAAPAFSAASGDADDVARMSDVGLEDVRDSEEGVAIDVNPGASEVFESEPQNMPRTTSARAKFNMVLTHISGSNPQEEMAAANDVFQGALREADAAADDGAGDNAAAEGTWGDPPSDSLL